MSALVHYDIEQLRTAAERDLAAFTDTQEKHASTPAEQAFVKLQAAANRANIDITVALTVALNDGLAPAKIATAVGALMGCTKAGVILNLARHDPSAIDNYFDAELAAASSIADGEHSGVVTRVSPMQGGRA